MATIKVSDGTRELRLNNSTLTGRRPQGVFVSRYVEGAKVSEEIRMMKRLHYRIRVQLREADVFHATLVEPAREQQAWKALLQDLCL